MRPGWLHIWLQVSLTGNAAPPASSAQTGTSLSWTASVVALAAGTSMAVPFTTCINLFPDGKIIHWTKTSRTAVVLTEAAVGFAVPWKPVPMSRRRRGCYWCAVKVKAATLAFGGFGDGYETCEGRRGADQGWEWAGEGFWCKALWQGGSRGIPRIWALLWDCASWYEACVKRQWLVCNFMYRPEAYCWVQCECRLNWWCCAF